MDNVFFYPTDLGKVGIADNGSAITRLYFDCGIIPQSAKVNETALIKEAFYQLQDYLAGKRRVFDFPVATAGTPFQEKVWKALQTIPYGQTKSYQDIAEIIGKPGAARAVGMANNKNPLLLVIPCHRVTAVNGNLVGYAAGLAVKERLLGLESSYAVG
jgi:methylated-DNA-[protein]-cysteine S-methyltransferase